MDGLRIRYRVQGTGRPLVLIHGLGASLELWDPFTDRLAGRQIITLDNPGAGLSSTPTRPFGIGSYAGVVEELLDHLTLTEVDLLGLSFGGLVAQEFARRHGDSVGRMILASTTCGWGGIPGNPAAMAVLATPLRYYSRTHFRRVAPILYGGRIRDDLSLFEQQAEIRHRLKPSLMGYLMQLAAANTWTSLPWLHTLKMPVLAISGRDDPIFPPANTRRLASRIPGAKLAIVPGGGHLVLLDSADEVAPLINGFLSEAGESVD